MVPRCFICWSRTDGAKVLYMLEQGARSPFFTCASCITCAHSSSMKHVRVCAAGDFTAIASLASVCMHTICTRVCVCAGIKREGRTCCCFRDRAGRLGPCRGRAVAH